MTYMFILKCALKLVEEIILFLYRISAKSDTKRGKHGYKEPFDRQCSTPFTAQICNATRRNQTASRGDLPGRSAPNSNNKFGNSG